MTMRLLALALCAVVAPFTVAGDNPIPLNPEIRFDTTEGAFTLRLDGRRAPLTTRNFVAYVRSGFYDGLVFHRVIPGFMAQGGGMDKDLTEKPTGDPIPNESGNGLSNARGTIAMARTNDPHSATSQFFINLVDNKRLDPSPARWGYTVFGAVTEGMEVIDKIAAIPTGARGPFRSDVPQTDVVIISAKLSNDPNE